jgi:hypothetical protein
MRKFLHVLPAVLAALCVVWAWGTAEAGDYHKDATLICRDCHTMHGQQEHGYNPSGSGQYTAIGTTGPYHYLLRNEINDLCLTCHDGQGWAPDVLEANTGTSIRQGGALNRTGAAPYYLATGHTLDAPDTAPGGTWAPDAGHGLTCTDCHHQHGRGSTAVPNGYRNLNPSVGGTSINPPSYAIGQNDTTKDVFERSAAAYRIADVDFNEPDPTNSAYATFCKGCHTDLHGAVGGPEIGGTGSPATEFVRHPSAGVDIGALTGGHSSKAIFALGAGVRTGTSQKINWVKVMTSTGNWTPNTTANVTDHTPSCFSCHKAHGNQNAFGLIYLDSKSGTQTEEGVAGGTYEDLCGQCHVQVPQ